MIKELDKLKKYVSTEEGKKILKDIRKYYLKSEKYANKLDRYFSLTMDGVEPLDAQSELGL